MRSKRWAEYEQAEEFFAGDPLGQEVLALVHRRVGALGGAELRVARTQVGWARRRGFAFLWCPSRWLGPLGAPLVLTLALPRRDAGSRWREVVEVRPGLWNLHLEVRDARQVDEDVLEILAEAYRAAG